MKRVTSFSIVAVTVAFAGLMVARTAVAGPIDPSGFAADADSFYPYNDPGVRMPIHAFNGSGLNAGVDTIPGTADDTHDGLNTTPTSSWMTQTNNGANPQPWTGQRWLMVNMGADYTIGAIQIWNYFESGAGSRGIKNTDIYYQTSTGTGAIPVGSGGDSIGGVFDPTNWSLLGNYTLTEATADPTPITDTITPGTAFVAQYVLFDIFTNYAVNPNTNETGMGQVRFLAGSEAPSGVPEPSTFVLAGLGLAGLGCVALRKRYRRG